jgi:hypothetical protein
MAATGLRDPVDALVAVEALRRVPSILITSDPNDLARSWTATNEAGA